MFCSIHNITVVVSFMKMIGYEQDLWHQYNDND